MKTLTYKLGVFLFILGSIPAFAFAQSTETNPAAFFPADIDFVYSLNTSAPNPFEDALADSIKENMYIEKTEEKELITNLTTKLIKESEIYFGMDMDDMMSETDMSYHDPEIYAAFKMSAEDFEILRNHYASDAKTENYQDLTIYGKNDGYAVFTNGWVFMTNNDANLKKMIDAGLGSNNLANTEAYKKVAANELEGSFFNMYINPAFVTKMNESHSTMSPFMMGGFDELFKNDIYKMIEAEGISVAYKDNGFDFSMTIEGNKEELQKAGLEFNKYNFTPALYKNISGNDLIMYGEKSNAKERLEDAFSMLNMDSSAFKEMATAFNDWKANFEKESGISLESDVLSLLTGRDLFALHNSHQLYPAATFVMEVNNTQKAGTVLTKFVDYLKKHFEKLENEIGIKFVSFNTTSINGTTYYEFQFKVAEFLKTTEPLNTLPADMTTLYLRMAVTTDGLLVISNHPDLGSVFKKESLTQNQLVSQKLGNMDEQVESVFFMNFASLNDYINHFMEKGGAPASAKEEVNNFMKVFGTLSGKAYSNSPESMIAKGRFEVDALALREAFTNFVMNFGLGTSSPDMPLPPPTPEKTAEKLFCDVSSNHWAYSYIEYLYKRGTVKGNPDGCFYPERGLNRAEFSTMLIRALELKNTLKQGSATQVFADVKPETWYFGDVNKASSNGYIHGFGNGTFGPDKFITRTELLQILYNASPILQASVPDENEPNYSDVKSTDWFYKALAAAYNEGLLPEARWGKGSTFEPHKQATRAEAAALLSVFLSLGCSEAPDEC